MAANNDDFPEPTFPAIPIKFPFLTFKLIFFRVGVSISFL
jgi:hypothetical protein